MVEQENWYNRDGVPYRTVLVTLRLRFDPASLSLSDSGAIWGGIWLECDDKRFPEYLWNDLVVAFACDLFDNLRCLGRDRPGPLRVRFFDGPFWVDLALDLRGPLRITAGSQRPALAWGCVSDAKQAIDGVAETCSDILSSCISSGWEANDDVRRLAEQVENYRRDNLCQQQSDG